MKKITICYWNGHIPGMKYRQGEEKEYDNRKLMRIIKYVTDKGYSLQLRPSDDGLIVLIDNGHFKQA